MFCFKCGSHQADYAKFCGACGTGLAGVLAPQCGPPVAVAPSVGPPPADSSPARETRAADSHLTVEEWAVTCSPPDIDGDVRFDAKVRGEFHGATAAHVARLSWIAFDSTGTIPLLQGDNTLNQDLDDEDSVEIEASGYGKLGEGVEPGACQVSGQVVLYPGEKQALWTIPLPEAGQTGGKGPTWSSAGAEIAAWRLNCSEGTDESASYTLFILVRNTSTHPLAAVTLRVRIKNRKGDALSTEHVVVERLAPGEMRSVETNLYVSERAKARKGAVLELVAIVSPQEIVSPLLPVQPVAQRPEPESDDTDDNEANDAESAAAEDSGDDTGGDAVTEEHNLDVIAEEERTMAKKTTRTKAATASQSGSNAVTLSAYWVGASWSLDETALRLFLKTTGFRSIEALHTELAKSGRYDAHPELDARLRPAFSFELAFSNCEGFEDTVFPGWDDCRKAPVSASIVGLQMEKTRGGGAGLTVRATARWVGVPRSDGIQAGWLSGSGAPKTANRQLREAVAGVLGNWTDIPCINLNYEAFPDLDEWMPNQVEETSLSVEDTEE